MTICIGIAFDSLRHSMIERASNELVYGYNAAPLIDTTFNGGNATLVAYGPTDSASSVFVRLIDLIASLLI